MPENVPTYIVHLKSMKTRFFCTYYPSWNWDLHLEEFAFSTPYHSLCTSGFRAAPPGSFFWAFPKWTSQQARTGRDPKMWGWLGWECTWQLSPLGTWPPEAPCHVLRGCCSLPRGITSWPEGSSTSLPTFYKARCSSPWPGVAVLLFVGIPYGVKTTLMVQRVGLWPVLQDSNVFPFPPFSHI